MPITPTKKTPRHVGGFRLVRGAFGGYGRDVRMPTGWQGQGVERTVSSVEMAVGGRPRRFGSETSNANVIGPIWLIGAAELGTVRPCRSSFNTR